MVQTKRKEDKSKDSATDKGKKEGEVRREREEKRGCQVCSKVSTTSRLGNFHKKKIREKTTQLRRDKEGEGGETCTKCERGGREECGNKISCKIIRL